jgi:hypothetical protein
MKRTVPRPFAYRFSLGITTLIIFCNHLGLAQNVLPRWLSLHNVQLPRSLHLAFGHMHAAFISSIPSLLKPFLILTNSPCLVKHRPNGTGNEPLPRLQKIRAHFRLRRKPGFPGLRAMATFGGPAPAPPSAWLLRTPPIPCAVSTPFGGECDPSVEFCRRQNSGNNCRIAALPQSADIIELVPKHKKCFGTVGCPVKKTGRFDRNAGQVPL